MYIEKDSSVNEKIEQYRLAATTAVAQRRDCIIVSSISCIYGLGSPKDYREMMIPVHRGELVVREELLLKLINIQYSRTEKDFVPGTFRVRGDKLDLWPAYSELALRIELWGNEVENLIIFTPESGEVISKVEEIEIFPAKHFVTTDDRIYEAAKVIEQELKDQLEKFRKEGKLLEAQRLESRTRYDLEMLRATGHCSGIENYSRPLSGKAPGCTPDTLHDYFPKDMLIIVDESHVTVPQVRAMFNGDFNRKKTLVDHGFRLPCAMDNRPLKFEEWEAKARQIVFVSATPADYEMEKTGGEVVEQVIRPTGLLDPVIEVIPALGQVNHLLGQIRERIAMGDRVLITTLTKRLAEDLANFFCDHDVKCRWMHSDLGAFERIELLRDLREGRCEVLVGVNLLREGLDLPEVSLVAILDADKEGFLRSETSLIQTIGRAARNSNSKVILYADRITDAMKIAMEETARRRRKQEEYNKQHGITPETVRKAAMNSFQESIATRKKAREVVTQAGAPKVVTNEYLKELEAEMMGAAEEMEFERAAALRDEIQRLKEHLGKPLDSVPAAPEKAPVQNKQRRGRGPKR